MSDEQQTNGGIVEAADVLRLLLDDGPTGILGLSEETGYTAERVREILRRLETERLVEPSDDGPAPTDRAEAFATGLDAFDVSPDEFVEFLDDREGSSYERIELAVEQRNGEWTATAIGGRTRGGGEQATGNTRGAAIESLVRDGSTEERSTW